MLRVKNLPLLTPRKKNTHKGSYGRVLILAGSPGMTGASYLCSKAALRSGSGIVTLGIPESLNPIMEVKLTCVMTHPLPETKASTLSNKGRKDIMKLCESHDVVALGPGLSQHLETRELILWLIKNIERTMVIDADGLNALANNVNVLHKIKQNVVLTPHPGEMSRLTGLRSAKDVQKERLDTAAQFVQSIQKKLKGEKKFVLVLKGDKTIVADYRKSYVNRTGNPGMATAGVGDVLTGIIVSLIGQGLDVFAASQLGVYIHGMAGNMAAKKKGELSMIATDIIDCLPDAFIKYKKERK
ncbi:MAG: Bifunctional NAD(P)H-hydrate repair enzyme Nnr [Candidatus Scalindua arabica]|uniref:ADP-dependent (S)-NAD(P)H-hydrate dehydratase n=1 Tax=Candidatus Scalindua arabica TaxID=1127984 RepID=A0A941W339_9BACT|nr:Bifunctional NAD(P)H-hydrate repair enzyme Nnr [Candidatus Scalindua arabica]